MVSGVIWRAIEGKVRKGLLLRGGEERQGKGGERERMKAKGGEREGE